MIAALCLAALLAGQSSDVGTTLALKHGYYEVNPLVPSHPVPFVALKASLTTSVAIAGWKIRKTHPKLAVFVFVLGATTGTYAAIHNARLLRQGHR